ncbi:MAG: deoxyribonuclease IV [Oscillospiraceae bacterium]|nr:deoxyribonuclease IV [Oscillospiraceae bacterium]
MFKIGCHLSSSGGYLAMGKEAERIGANTFQFFTRNPRGGQAKPLDLDDIKAFEEYRKDAGIISVLAHAPYTMNACSKDAGLRDFAKNTMLDDIYRLDNVNGAMYNFHPGSHVGQGEDVGINFISDMLNEVLSPTQKTTVLLETMAGKGSEVGRSFEEIKAIIDKVRLKDKLGVCLDTCHVFDGGYDIVENLDGVLEEFDNIIGLDKLKAIHLNDSMNYLGCHKDRHAKIGEGGIGLEAITRIINHEKLRDLPFFLETPNDIDGYEREIALLKSLYKE